MIQAIAIALSSAGLLISLTAFFVIRSRYRSFCIREDQKERISVIKKKISSAGYYIRKNYNTPMDTSIYDNVMPKVEFLEKLISNKSLDDQEKEYQFLLDMLTETFIRLKDNYDDVAYILSPLNSMRDRLVQEHIQFLKDHMPDGM